MTRIYLSCALAGVFVISGAHAQVAIDVSKITCEQMSKASNPLAVELWLSGYYAGKRNDPTIDVVAVNQNADKVAEYCKSHPDEALMKAVEASVGPSK
jgi:hypothetical protein